jgi:hypothetical protein
MTCRKVIYYPFLFILLLSVLSCSSKKNPPRDEIPVIKDLLADLEMAIKDKNPEVIDSLMADNAAELGYNSEQILSAVYSDTGENQSYSFGKRDFFYVKDKARVNCFIIADSTDPGRELEITLIKKDNRWKIKRFDLK